MEPDEGVEQMDLEGIRARIMENGDGSVDRRKVADNTVLGLIAECEFYRVAIAAREESHAALVEDHARCVRALRMWRKFRVPSPRNAQPTLRGE